MGKGSSERRKIIKELLNSTDREFTDEELIHQLIDTKITKNSEANERRTFGQRASDAVAANIILASRAFDAYPFILLNLVLSCIAAVQAPLIMMSQNRQEAKDRERAENDYKVNLKNELIIDDLHKKVDRIMENQEKILRRLESLEADEKSGDTDKQ